jgi:hypothetical protein
MSSSCHFFFEGNLGAKFRARVVITVALSVTFDKQTLPFRGEREIAGTSCLISTNSVDVLHATARWQAPAKDGFCPAFEIDVVVEPALDNAPRRPMHFRGTRHLVFAFLPFRSFVTYDLLRRRASFALSTLAARDESFWSTMLVPITMGILGTTVGLVPLHSACLERDGSGFLLAGVSGAGKSTLTAALAQSGCELISDDWTYISNGESGLTGHGLSAPVKLLPDAARFFPALKQSTLRVALNGELAYEVDSPESMGFCVKSASLPRRIFFLERTTSAGCDFLPCRPAYVKSFFEQNAERLPDELAEAKAFRSHVFQLVSGLPAWVVRTGKSPHGTALELTDFLSERDHAAA